MIRLICFVISHIASSRHPNIRSFHFAAVMTHDLSYLIFWLRGQGNRHNTHTHKTCVCVLCMRVLWRFPCCIKLISAMCDVRRCIWWAWGPQTQLSDDKQSMGILCDCLSLLAIMLTNFEGLPCWWRSCDKSITTRRAPSKGHIEFVSCVTQFSIWIFRRIHGASFEYEDVIWVGFYLEEWQIFLVFALVLMRVNSFRWWQQPAIPVSYDACCVLSGS